MRANEANEIMMKRKENVAGGSLLVSGRRGVAYNRCIFFSQVDGPITRGGGEGGAYKQNFYSILLIKSF